MDDTSGTQLLQEAKRPTITTGTVNVARSGDCENLKSHELLREIERAAARHPQRADNIFRRCERRTRRHFDECFMYWWRHPCVRFIAPIYILVTDLLAHAADPFDHIEIEYALSPIGEAFNLINFGNGQPLSVGGHIAKVIVALSAVVLGCYMPWCLRQFCCKRGCRRYCKGSRGAFLMPLIFVCICLTVFAQLWNLFHQYVLHTPLPEGVMFEQTRTVYFSSGFNSSFRVSANIVDSWVFFLDFVTLAMVVDLVLQDGSLYPKFMVVRGRDIRKIWTQTCGGKLRLLVTWLCFLATGFGAMCFVWKTSRVQMTFSDVTPTTSWLAAANTELSRSWLYATQFFFDSLIIQQDWEFPTFENEMSVAFLGTNVALEGRFFNYVVLVGVALIDLKCLAATVFTYDPSSFAQYTDPKERIWSVTDSQVIANMQLKDPPKFSFEERVKEGCFVKLDATEAAKRECYSWLNPERHDVTFHYEEEFGIYTMHGFNACCDQRLRATYTGKYFSAKHGWFWKGICFVPAAVTTIFGFILAYFIATSKREMCRRVVLTKMISCRIDQETIDAHGDLSRLDVLRLRNEVYAEYATADNDVRRSTPKDSSPPCGMLPTPMEDCEDEEDIDVEDDGCGLYPVLLRRPPQKRSPLLLICHTGAYSVQAGISARIEDLCAEIDRRQIAKPIRPENFRLRIKPKGHLKEDVWLGSLLPHGKDQQTCIFLHATLSRDNSQDDDVFRWPMRLVCGIFRGTTAYFCYIFRACGFICGCSATQSERVHELRTCCCKACGDCIRGGKPDRPVQIDRDEAEPQVLSEQPCEAIVLHSTFMAPPMQAEMSSGQLLGEQSWVQLAELRVPPLSMPSPTGPGARAQLGDLSESDEVRPVTPARKGGTVASGVSAFVVTDMTSRRNSTGTGGEIVRERLARLSSKSSGDELPRI